MYPALILAGGASTRMGVSKSTMLVAGSQMIVHVAHALREGGCTTLYIAVRNGYQRIELMSSLAHLTDIKFILDEGVMRGSKDGLRSALQICRSLGVSRIQLAPCDIPWIKGEVFERLRSENRAVVIPRAIQLQPLIALIEVNVVLKGIEEANIGDSLKRIMRSLPNKVVDFNDSKLFRNINRAEDISG